MKKCLNGHELPAQFVFVSPHFESARTCWEFMSVICSNDGKHLGASHIRNRNMCTHIKREEWIEEVGWARLVELRKRFAGHV